MLARAVADTLPSSRSRIHLRRQHTSRGNDRPVNNISPQSVPSHLATHQAVFAQMRCNPEYVLWGPAQFQLCINRELLSPWVGARRAQDLCDDRMQALVIVCRESEGTGRPVRPAASSEGNCSPPFAGYRCILRQAVACFGGAPALQTLLVIL